MEKSLEILEKYWGYKSFRPLQEEIVDSVIYGHDTFAILPTGGGKSICFQVPGLTLEGLTLVISPLIALMEDQVKTLNSKGIKSILISSAMSYREIDVALDNARFGNVSFLYTSPERLKSTLFLERFKQMNISLIVVDEAHCISEWGHDFRPAYREIEAIKKIHPNAPIIALTASATPEVQDDIIEQLKLKEPKIFRGDVKRHNISYEAIETENKIQTVIEYCKRHPNQCGIIYCQTRKEVKDVVMKMRTLQISAGMYHGGMLAADRSYMLDLWLKNQIRIMVATNAFGMGIDKSDVRFVLHIDAPNNLEAYYQEAGRAGRDGNTSLARIYWDKNSINHLNDQVKLKYPPIDRIKTIYSSICNFLQVAVGSGEMEVYEFDILGFSKVFKFGVGEIYNSLKLLELNETISLLENNFFPTRLKFTIGSSALYKFQVAHESTAQLIQLLTRSYPGIFERYINVDELELSKRLNTDKSTVRQLLQYMEKYGVIEIRYQSTLPQLTLISPRIDEKQLQLKSEVFFQRKKTDELKLNAMIDYITTDYCRSALIAIYFGFENEKCGICDNCRVENNEPITEKELQSQIASLLPLSLEEITEISNLNIEQLKPLLRSLVLEEKLIYKESKFYANS